LGSLLALIPSYVVVRRIVSKVHHVTVMAEVQRIARGVANVSLALNYGSTMTLLRFW
jgi:hypothetical protein